MGNRLVGFLKSALAMLRPTSLSTLIFDVFICSLMMTALPQSLMADDESGGSKSGFNALETHQHAAIHVNSRPVVERIPVNVIDPVDVRVAADGAILVADAKANRKMKTYRRVKCHSFGGIS